MATMGKALHTTDVSCLSVIQEYRRRGRAKMVVLVSLATIGLVLYRQELHQQLGLSRVSTQKRFAELTGGTRWTPTKYRETEHEWRKKMEHRDPTVVAFEDDLISGKSCLRESNAWDCRDCGTASTNNSHTNRHDCPKLPRNYICEPFFNGMNWDGPARQWTKATPASTTTSHLHVLSHYGMQAQHEQIQCDALEDCFDMRKCPPDGQPMKVFAHGDGLASDLVTRAVQHYPRLLVQTLEPSDACLLVVTCDSYPNASQLLQHLYNYGRNHFVWEAAECFGAHGDRPFDTKMNYQHAALATGTTHDANSRRGYDVPLARVKLPSFQTTVLPRDEDRRHLLLSFKGNIFPWDQVWWQHRWLAAEYWNTTTDAASNVFLDVTCPGKKTYTLPPSSYGDLLLNSTFGFAPGGGGVGSYRFGEVLGLGGIPVVLPDLLPPMWPDLDWSGCIVRVSEARIVDLPRILGSISKEEIRSRQKRCKFLFQQTIGWNQIMDNNSASALWEIDSGKRAFLTSMKVWHARIQDYHSRQSRQGATEAMDRR